VVGELDRQPLTLELRGVMLLPRCEVVPRNPLTVMNVPPTVNKVNLSLALSTRTVAVPLNVRELTIHACPATSGKRLRP
jgi:hypothetical protein